MIYNFPFWVLGYILLSAVIGLVSYFVSKSQYLANNGINNAVTSKLSVQSDVKKLYSLRVLAANSYRLYAVIVTSLVMACYFGVQLIGCGTFYLNIMFPVVSAMTVFNWLLVTNAFMLIISLLVMFYFKKQVKHILDKIDAI